ncbi:hypothetical protein BVG16_16355 [Paenibacillus selenitireducens]|uniref:Phage tail protein n=1 Tax=Paenibacillus selenitireducens TaxID=1324314 RepID=A0A1T2XAA7_9BACL|nr:hypothetical protein [Paenibacillus selenitireducens]OPA76742.1 hypothetical protein BVG16_16355 [Paenibacillus selenitireducens]
MAFKHGVSVNERGTKITGQKSVDSAITVVIGTAPMGRVNVPFVARSRAEAVAEFGFSEDFESFTLSEAIDSHFSLYKQSYAILVNVLDPSLAKKSTTNTVDLLQRATVTSIQYPLVDSVKLKKDAVTYVKDTDFTVALDKDGFLVISLTATSTITTPSMGLTITYDAIDVSKVKNTDIIGVVDPATGKKTGLEILDDIMPLFGVIPGLVIAPKFSTDPVVATAMIAKAQNINGMFKAFALTDLDTKLIRTKQKAIESKKVGDPGQDIMWPKVQKNGRIYHMSTHKAGLIGQMDAANSGVPSNSPSNRLMQVDGLVLADKTPVSLGPNDANDLNGVGISTVLSFTGGPRAWGNRTAAHPNLTDMKDIFIHAKRMMFWINNWIIIDTWENVDANITKRFIEAVTTKHNIRLNGLTSMGAILGGTCKYDPLENPVTQLIEGTVNFSLSVGIPGVAENIQFGIEIDPTYLATLSL